MLKANTAPNSHFHDWGHHQMHHVATGYMVSCFITPYIQKSHKLTTIRILLPLSCNLIGKQEVTSLLTCRFYLVTFIVILSLYKSPT